jgi:predicted MPP superfamily phosphohydrolase
MFLAVGLSILFVGHFYIAWRINSGLSIPPPYKYYLYAIAIFFAFFMLAVQITFRSGMPSFLSPIASIAFVAMGCFAITICVFLLNDIINIANLILKIKSFRFWSTIIAIVLSAILCISALINFAYGLKIEEVHIKVPNLPIPSLKIVQIADLHINALTKTETINDIFDKVEKLNPDMIVFVGDIIDIDINKDDKFLDYGFGKLKAPYGIFAVTGNHEYHTNVNAFYEMFQKLGVKVLNDENVLVKNTINIAGINDKNWRNPQKIEQALLNANPKYPILFLSHRPETFNYAQNYADIIQLSGHTHAGQIPPVWIIRKFFMQYNYGLYKAGRSIMYITSGTRLWGPPMRLFSRSEIAVIILERE